MVGVSQGMKLLLTMTYSMQFVVQHYWGHKSGVGVALGAVAAATAAAGRAKELNMLTLRVCLPLCVTTIDHAVTNITSASPTSL